MKSLLRALIVEDSEADTQLLLRELERSNYQIAHLRVESAEALSAALNQENWDMLFCDFTMPHFSGQTALEIVRARDRVVPFIFVSGTLGEHFAVKAIKAGANDYVMKSDLVRLVPAMERELREAAERRHAEEKPRESTVLAVKERALSDLALAKLPVLFYVYDEGGKLLQWNINLELISGYGADGSTD
jgi:DNA-binding NtrC family response regulator